MEKFGVRVGAREARTAIQTTSLDDATRTDIWNLVIRIRESLAEEWDFYSGDVLEKFERDMWSDHYKLALDTYTNTRFWALARKTVLEGEWADALEFVEELRRSIDYVKRPNIADSIIKAFNYLFSTNLVGYRFVDRRLTSVIDDIEVESIETAVEATTQYVGAQESLKRALAFLSDRKDPQYAKSVVESISAVEAIVRHLTGAGTLGGGLKALKAKGFNIHPALEGGWSKIYGYTSDGGNLRHGAVEAAEVDEALASYFLVSCSAFINLLVKVSVDDGLA